MEINIYSLVAPAAIFLLLAEIAYDRYKNRGLYTFQETITNLGTAIGNQTVNLAIAAGIYVSYGWLYENYAIMQIEQTWYNFIIMLVGIDFLFYWFHRAGHRVNILWAAHMPHHSAEEMNIAVGLRASITQRLASFFFFWPLVIVGYEPVWLYTGVGFHLFLSLWHHTEVIRRFPAWFEWFFNTPSHHRVHHGMNRQYLDKNFSEMLIIWDRIFGTWEKEVEPPAYGVIGPPNTWNPVFINFQHWIYLFKTSFKAPHLADKFLIWIKPPEWRPRGMEGNKVDGITREEQVRFRSTPYNNSRLYLLIQTVLGMALMGIVISPKFEISSLERIMMSGWLWLMIIAWSGLLESRAWGKTVELIRLLGTGGSLIYILQVNHIGPPAAQAAVAAVYGLSALHLTLRLKRPAAEEIVYVKG